MDGNDVHECGDNHGDNHEPKVHMFHMHGAVIAKLEGQVARHFIYTQYTIGGVSCIVSCVVVLGGISVFGRDDGAYSLSPIVLVLYARIADVVVPA